MGNTLQRPAAKGPGNALRHRNRAAQYYLLQLTEAPLDAIVFLAAPDTGHRWLDFESVVQDTCPAIDWEALSQQPSLACKPFRDTPSMWLFNGFPLLDNGRELQDRKPILGAAIGRAAASGAHSVGIALPSAGPELADDAVYQDIEAWYALTSTIGQHVSDCPAQIDYFHPAHSWTIRNEGS